MKLWIAIALVSLLACGDSTKEEVDSGEKPPAVEQRPAPRDDLDLDGGGGWSGPCDRNRDVVTLQLDGATWTVAVPTLCDQTPTPYIEKGDPPWQKPSFAK